uniref:Uncharacterized protein n=2 Tax=Methylophaga nitratireducenticrescens TaxID=754476 RepID=I1XG47_METNJ
MLLLARVAVSLLAALLLGGIFFYGYLAGLIGNPSHYAKWLVPLFFYAGILLCLTGVIFTLVEKLNWARRSFAAAIVLVVIFAGYLLLIEPKLQQREQQNQIKTMQQLYQQYSLQQLDCDDKFQAHLSKIEQRPAEVVLFQKANFSQPVQYLAGWDKSASMNNCRFIENTYALGTQRSFLSRCQNQQHTTVADLIAQAKRLGCQ